MHHCLLGSQSSSSPLMYNFSVINVFGPSNKGDDELLSQLLIILDTNFPGSTVNVFSSTSFCAQDISSFYKCSTLRIILHKSFIYRPTTLRSLVYVICTLAYVFMSSYPFLRSLILRYPCGLRTKVFAVLSSDLIISCPGGYLYSNSLSLYSNLLNLSLCRSLNHSLILSPMSIGPFLNPVDSYITALVVKSVKHVFARESYTLALCRSLGIPALSCPDLAWISDVPQENVSTPWSGHFCMSVIAWKIPGRSLFSSVRFYVQQIVNAASKLYAYSGKRIVLFSQLTSSASPLDSKLIGLLARQYPDLFVVDPRSYSPSELKMMIRSSLGIFASRFHSALFALQACTPCVAVSYQPKTEYILRDNSMNDSSLPINSSFGCILAEKLIGYAEEREVFSQFASQAIKRNIESINSVFVSYLFSFLEKTCRTRGNSQQGKPASRQLV